MHDSIRFSRKFVNSEKGDEDAQYSDTRSALLPVFYPGRMHPGQVVNVLRSAPASVLDPTCCVARPRRYAVAVPCPQPDWRASVVPPHHPGIASI